MTDYIHLDEHVGRVLVPNLPTDDDAYLVCLTSQELHIIRAFVFPYASWRTRFVRWVQDNLFQTATPEELSAYQELVEGLDENLGGALMPCSDIGTGLQAIATALAGLQPVAQTVNCGAGGAGGGVCSGVVGAVSGMTPAQAIPQTLIIEPSQAGDPPEGFETWEVYFTRKCQASHALFAWIRNFLLTMQSASGAAQNMASAIGVVGMIMAVLGLLIDPVAMVGLAVGVLAVLLISTDALIKVNGAVDYLDENKDDIICAFYSSGSALQVQAIATGAIEDALQAIEWGEVFAPLGAALETAIGAVGSQLLSNNVVNVLFYAAEDVVLPTATCECGGAQEWHFDAGVEGWIFVGEPPSPVTEEHGWTQVESGKDPSNGSAGRLFVEVDMVAFNPPSFYPSWERYLPPGTVVAIGDTLVADVYAGPDQSFISLGIVYTDDTEDSTGWTSWVNWGLATCTVTEPNNGKTVKFLYAVWERRATGAGLFALDKVILNT
jgi:hypothetical protein